MRTRPILAIRLTIALAVTSAAIAVPTAAIAAPQSESKLNYSTTVFGSQVGHGIGTTVAEQYALSRKDHSRGAALKAQFLKDAASRGHFYDANAVDYLHFRRQDGVSAEAVVPQNYRIDTVAITATRDIDGKRDILSAAVQGGEIEASNEPLFPTGPGFDNFTFVKDGDYRLTVNKCTSFGCQKRQGKLDFHWSKYKDKFESNGSVDLWAYSRWAVATPLIDHNGEETWLQKMNMRSYPTSSTRSVLRGWNGMSPLPGSYDGNCSTSMSIGVANVGGSFTPCESWKIDWNSNTADAGDMHFTWENSSVLYTRGVQNMAAIFSAKTAQGTTPYYKDWINVDFSQVGGCAATDGSTTCNNNS